MLEWQKRGSRILVACYNYYNQVPKLTAIICQCYVNSHKASRNSKLTMHSLDLCVGRKSVLPKLATNTTLLVASEGNTEVTVL